MSLPEILLFNPVLLSALIAWFIAQSLKVVIELITNKQMNWGLLFQAGGMPSSHSAMVSAAALSAGLLYGFDSPVFSIAAVLAHAREDRPPVVASLCGLEGDPQGYRSQLLKLTNAGVIVAPSNAHTSELALTIITDIK